MAQLVRRIVARMCGAVAVACLVLLAPSAPVSACSCGPLSESEALDIADAVFVGEVTGVDDSGEFDEPFVVRYSFDVDSVHKGEAFETQSLVTPQDEAACGLEMEVGVDWVIYATRPGEVDDTVIDDTELASNLCSLSRPLADATLSPELGDGERPESGASATSGDGDDDGGIPGIVFGLGFVVLGLAIGLGGAFFTQRRRIRD